MYVWSQRVYEKSVPSAQFCYELKTALKQIKCIRKKEGQDSCDKEERTPALGILWPLF